MVLRLHLVLLSFSALLFSQAPTLAVDANSSRKPISPLIYGINEWSDNGLLQLMHVPVLRWGGDDATSYNWTNSVKNNTGDNPWCYENYGVSPGFDAFHTANLVAGTVSLGTIPLMDWSPNTSGVCSFSVKKYGAQKATAPDNADCGNGVLLNGNPVANDPNDAYVPVTTSFATQWVQHIMSSYGPAAAGGVRLWSMDNEPEWWYSNHVDVYPQAASYDDMLARNLKWAQAVKSVDPTALVTGPVPGGWSGMLFSRVDFDSGWGTSPYQYWDNPIDQKAHGGVPWVPVLPAADGAVREDQRLPAAGLSGRPRVHCAFGPERFGGRCHHGNPADDFDPRALGPQLPRPRRRIQRCDGRGGGAAPGPTDAAVDRPELSRHQPRHHRI